MIARDSPFKAFSPFCIADWVYRKGTRDLHRLVDATLLDALLFLRASYPHLIEAASIARDLLCSQMQEKPAPQLYALSYSYLHQLPHFARPQTLALSFRLKLLKHEGVLAAHPFCTLCSQTSRTIQDGESFCAAHASTPLLFTEEEWNQILLLAHAKEFSQLRQLEISPSCEGKIKDYFKI